MTSADFALLRTFAQDMRDQAWNYAYSDEDVGEAVEALLAAHRRLVAAVAEADARTGCECSSSAGHRVTCWKFDLLAALPAEGALL